ncbi:MAG: hypothetical protein ACREOH_04020 [Candidatus Entotheonellia bacterium]
MRAQQAALTNGPAAAAILASSIGSLALGLFTTLAQAIAPIKDALNFYNPAGPLSGKTTVAVVVWLIAWAVFYGRWKNTEVNFPNVFRVTLILIALGLVGTFPVFFELFGG